MTTATQSIDTGDIVKVAGDADGKEWRVFWIYREQGQVELVGDYHRQYPEGSVAIDRLTLIRKGEKTA